MAIMTASRFTTNDSRTEMNFNNLNDMQSTQHTCSSLESRPHNQEHQHQKTGDDNRGHASKTDSRGCCSKPCLIGLGIGLTIGVLLVIIVAVSIGLTKKSSPGIGSTTPNWIGKFQMDTACDTSTCCCLSNEIQLSQTNNDQMQIVGGVTGLCTSYPSTISLTQPMPTSHQMLITWSGQKVRLHLSQDNTCISFVNINYAYCSASALRISHNAGNMKNMDMGLAILTLLITIGVTILSRYD